uniref:Uncharacterized protein n=1 Tax=Periophthalmus magnuspinnatus TaxID=409849 RepID=A0A3B4AG47_9GOBI
VDERELLGQHGTRVHQVPHQRLPTQAGTAAHRSMLSFRPEAPPASVRKVQGPGLLLPPRAITLEPGAEAAHPAGTLRPSAVGCHGISTKMLFLQHNTRRSYHDLLLSRFCLL